jgi:hypothetical protein
MNPAVLRGHAAANRLQTLLLVGALLAIGGLAGFVLFGESGLWLALAAMLFILVVEPLAATRLTLALYKARPIEPAEAPQVWHTLDVLAERAGLPAVPVPHYVPSPMVNAFAVGNRQQSAIALTDGLLALVGQAFLILLLPGWLAGEELENKIAVLLAARASCLPAKPWGRSLSFNWPVLAAQLAEGHSVLRLSARNPQGDLHHQRD